MDVIHHKQRQCEKKNNVEVINFWTSWNFRRCWLGLLRNCMQFFLLRKIIYILISISVQKA